MSDTTIARVVRRIASGRGTSAATALVVLAALLAACGGEEAAGVEDGGEPSTATAEAAEASTDAASGAGEEGRMAQTGDTVSVHYRGTLDDGSEFDSSAGRAPLTFVVGAGDVIAGFDAAVTGMEVGEKKTFRLTPDQAYGDPRGDLVVTVEAASAPEGLTVGDQVRVGSSNTPAVVTAIAENGDVTVDANHPLAGEALTFEIELVGIR